MPEPEKESTPINASINEIKTIKPKGGKRPGAGRPKGVPNILTREIKELAGQYGPEAVKKLKDLMRRSVNEQVQLGATKELLDRGFGRPTQEVDMNDKRVVVHIHREAARPPIDKQPPVDVTAQLIQTVMETGTTGESTTVDQL